MTQHVTRIQKTEIKLLDLTLLLCDGRPSLDLCSSVFVSKSTTTECQHQQAL